MKTHRYAMAVLLLAVAGCGGSAGAPPTTPPVVIPPAAMADAFFRAVQGAIGLAPEDQEPTDIAAVAVTAPDDTEPEKVAP